MELVLSKPEDIKKLEGWTIKSGVVEVQGADPVLVLSMSHPAAEFPIKLEIKPTVSIGRNGNIIVCNQMLRLHIEDIK